MPKFYVESGLISGTEYFDSFEGALAEIRKSHPLAKVENRRPGPPAVWCAMSGLYRVHINPSEDYIGSNICILHRPDPHEVRIDLRWVGKGKNRHCVGTYGFTYPIRIAYPGCYDDQMRPLAENLGRGLPLKSAVA